MSDVIPIGSKSLDRRQYMSIDQEAGTVAGNNGVTPFDANAPQANPSLLGSFLLCLIVGPGNFVLYKVMYDAYGDRRAFFVSQGVNFLYVVYGGIILWYLTKSGEISDETRNMPHKKFIVMGFLDCVGGFLGAMGAGGTSGSLQQLLNQTLIPITMLLSWFFLGRKSGLMQVIGALLIMYGAWIVISASNDSSPATGNLSMISNLLYFCSNIPIALSSVYKEHEFNDVHMHVMHMTQWVSVYQFLFGFLAGLLQVVPGVGSLEGSSISEIISSFVSGLGCFLQQDATCAEQSAFFLLTGYCVVNFAFNIVGLCIVKYESATLSTITNALILPLTVLSFNLPWLGRYREHSGPETWMGLSVVLVGFALWKLSSGAGTVQEQQQDSEKQIEPPRAPEGFSDRVIFLSIED